MAYMHKETFEILQHSNIDGYLDDYFEVDDLIALPIQVLNRKGYRTLFCCCGHPFEGVDEAFSATKFESPEKCPIIGTYKIEENTNDEFSDCDYRLLIRQSPDWSSYITFGKNVTLPSLPEGFGIDEKNGNGITYMPSPLDENGEETDPDPLENTTTIRTYYDEDMPVYGFLTELAEAMRDLYEWALSLPEAS